MTEKEYSRNIELSLIRINNIKEAIKIQCINDIELFETYTTQIRIEQDYIIKIKTKYENIKTVA